jgi:transcriptional regulator with XRE-family HTH domain
MAMHPLAQYLEEHHETQTDFAQRAGLERTTVTKVLSGERKRFSPEAAQKIVKATNGKVSLEEALGFKKAA